jgi:hypothetical protein
MSENTDKGVVREAVLRIKWRDPGPALFATEVAVLGTADSVHFAFYQVLAPVSATLGGEEESKRLLENGTIDAVPIAHIAVPHSKLDGIIQALLEYKRKHDEGRGGA